MLINEGTMTALCQQVWGKIKKIWMFLKETGNNLVFSEFIFLRVNNSFGPGWGLLFIASTTICEPGSSGASFAHGEKLIN